MFKDEKESVERMMELSTLFTVEAINKILISL